MRHPLTNNVRLLLAYVLFWGIISIINTVLQVYWYDVPLTYSLLDTGTNYVLFPLLGSSIWYSIRYNSLEEVSAGRLLLFASRNRAAAKSASKVDAYSAKGTQFLAMRAPNFVARCLPQHARSRSAESKLKGPLTGALSAQVEAGGGW